MAQETFANRLGAAMSERGLKQVDLVRVAAEKNQKLGKSQVSQYVSGKVTPRSDVMDLLAEILGVDAGWLATGEGARAAARPETAHEPASPTSHTQRSVTMRQFKKSTKLDNVLYDVRGPVADEAARMEDEGSSSTSETRPPLASARPTRSFTTCASSCPSARATLTPAVSSPPARRSCSTPSSSIFPT